MWLLRQGCSCHYYCKCDVHEWMSSPSGWGKPSPFQPWTSPKAIQRSTSHLQQCPKLHSALSQATGSTKFSSLSSTGLQWQSKRPNGYRPLTPPAIHHGLTRWCHPLSHLAGPPLPSADKALQGWADCKPMKVPSGADQGTAPQLPHQSGSTQTSRKEDGGCQEQPRPSNKKRVHAFLGLAGYYHRFIPNFSSLASPLSDFSRKGVLDKVSWTAQTGIQSSEVCPHL